MSLVREHLATMPSVGGGGGGGSNPTRSMDVRVRLFCVCAVLCAGSGLATG
jgi:hypothetical protein